MRLARPSSLLLALVVAVSGCAGNSKLTRGETKARELEGLLLEAEQATHAFDLSTAKSILAESRDLVRDPVLRESPDQAVLLDRFNQDQSDLEIAFAEKAKRDFEASVVEQRKRLDKLLAQLLKVVSELEKKEVTDAQLSTVKDAIETIRSELVATKDMEAKAPSYAEDARHARRVIDRTAEPVTLAKLRLTFRKGPVAMLDEAADLLDATQREIDAAKRKDLSSKAAAKYKACVDEGKKQVAATAALAGSVVIDQPKPATATIVIAACEAGIGAATKAAVPSAVKKPAPAAAPAAPAAPPKKPAPKKKK